MGGDGVIPDAWEVEAPLRRTQPYACVGLETLLAGSALRQRQGHPSASAGRYEIPE
jgi:hypothetical protein